MANEGLGPFVESDLRDVPTRSSSRSGVFYLMSETRWADFDDGTSSTALVSEFRVVPNDFRGVMFYPEGPFYQHSYTPNSTVPDIIRTSFCVNEPKSPCQGGFNSYRPRSQIITARSDHPGGVNLALGDGSVRFVSNTIAIEVWKALATPTALPGEALVSQY